MAEKDAGLQKAIDAIGGKAEALATELKITPQAISQWTQVPLGRVFHVERATGVSRHILRPDFFGSSPEKESAA
jgi:DNA-binding transcriptional regulator YdaS (Cro superfamily)